VLAGVRVIDCVPFFNELDLLEVRLVELEGIVDRHVVVEATTTHRGTPKQAVFWPNRHRFARFLHRIDYRLVDLPDAEDPWVRERAQRDVAIEALEDAGDDDLVLLCDVDEVPRSDALPRVLDATRQGPVVLGMRLYVFALHWRDPATWLHPKAARMAHLRRMRGTLSDLRLTFDLPVVAEAGWHFSSFHNPEQLRQKLTSFAHAELDRPEVLELENLRAAIEGGVTLKGTVLERVEDPFPPHVRTLLGRYGTWDEEA
jgi:beta-1,4-mannosyl-glycoprotein beta-1,4-N-acetylglucosaminyltransferase